MKLELDGVYTGETDNNGKKIFFETSILKFPNGNIGKLRFDYGQLMAYFADEKGFCIVELEGVNNCKSYYLNDCEVI